MNTPQAPTRLYHSTASSQSNTFLILVHTTLFRILPDVYDTVIVGDKGAGGRCRAGRSRRSRPMTRSDGHDSPQVQVAQSMRELQRDTENIRCGSEK